LLGAVIVPRERPLVRSPETMWPVVGALLAHLALALLLKAHPGLGTAYAVGTVAVVLGVAILSPWVDLIATAVGYLVGAELVWRMTSAKVPYELGKYGLVLAFGIGLLRLGRLRRVSLPLAFFAVLVPSAVLTVEAVGIASSREAISFNLSGPLAIAVSMLFFSQLRATWLTLQPVLWAVIAPVATIAALALLGTIEAESVVFSGASNAVTSGGFGPNQVSAVLGLGALFAIVLSLRETRQAGRHLAVLIALWLLAQSALTFSRGGLVNVAVGLLLAALYSLRRPQQTSRLIGPLLVLVLLGGLVVYPRLVAFTGNEIEKRFTDLSLDDRERIVRADLDAFLSHPLLGVGPGMANDYRRLADGRGVSAHTEFTRLPAEHGVAGLLALALLLAMVVRSYQAAPTPRSRAWVLLLAGWALTEMAHGAVRMAAIAYVLGLTACQLALDRASPVEKGT
jgi:O-antigen ligase